MAGFTLTHYVNQFLRLLPAGPLWPTQEQTTASWQDYIRAMVGEHKRVDTKINDWLVDYLPDAPVDQLEDWERILSIPESLAECGIDIADLSTAERQALVRFYIALAPTNVADLEALATPFGHTATIVQPSRQSRYSGFLSGQRYGGTGWASSYLYEYMTNLTPAPNDMSDAAWTKTNATITANDARAPDGTLTADHVDITSSFGTIRSDDQFSSISAGDTVQISAWIKADSAADVTMVWDLEQTGASPSIESSPTFTVGTGAPWRRFDARIVAGTSATAYYVRLRALSGTAGDFHVWGFYAGVVDTLLDYHVKKASPVHTTPLPRVLGDTQGWALTYP